MSLLALIEKKIFSSFGRSSRVKFPSSALEVEQEFVESIEEWRKAMGLDKVILLGHSLGGYLVTAYAIQHPDHVRHLILADPWGFPERPAEFDRRAIPMWVRVVASMIQPFNPFAALRMAGPWGPSLVARFKSDLIEKYSHLYNDETISEYLYHCNAQTPSGETAFKSMTLPYGWAKFPMINRIHQLPSHVAMTMIHGSRSWVDYGISYAVKYRRQDSFVDVQILRGAGHHVYADKPDLFNMLVNRTCTMVDQTLDRTHSSRFLKHLSDQFSRNSKEQLQSSTGELSEKDKKRLSDTRIPKDASTTKDEAAASLDAAT